METSTLAIGTMAINLLGGLAVFLFGLDQLTETLKATAGNRMRVLLASVTTNRFKGVLAGSVTTAVIQSSSVTTVLVVGFVSAGLMNLQQSIGVIMGAEIGTTITAQMIAFKVTKYALIAVIVGFIMQFFFANERVKRYGLMILGLGLVFYGMNMMGDATRPLRTHQPFIDLLAGMDSHLLAILMSASFTALIQSSSATTGVIIVLASQGLITLEQGIALVLGANIGTCVTALLAAIGKQRPALRAALIHVLFNVSGVCLWVNFVDPLADLMREVSPVAAGLVGIDKLAQETPRQIANAHTFFNVCNTLIFIWFTGVFAWIVTKLVPEKRPSGPGVIEPRFLDPVLLDTPALALDAARMELVRLGTHLKPMLKDSLRVTLEGSESDLSELEKQDEDIDILHAEIVHYLSQVVREKLTPAETEKHLSYLNIANQLENIGDMIEADLVRSGRRRIRKELRVSADTRSLFEVMTRRIEETLDTALDAVDRQDQALAKHVVEAKVEINRLAEDLSRQLADRLVAQDPNRTETFAFESQIVENYKRIYYFAKRLAKDLAVADSIEDSEPPIEGSSTA